MAKRKKTTEPAVYRITMGPEYRGASSVRLTVPKRLGREARQCAVSATETGEILLWSDELFAVEARGFEAEPINSKRRSLTFEEAPSDNEPEPEPETDASDGEEVSDGGTESE